MKKLAIVGSGIAGLSAAYYLRDQYEITIFEKNNYVGGHTRTLDFAEDGKSVSLDTGFMVFNHVTYPNLTKLFAELDVATKRTDMSFSVQQKRFNLEYSGASFNRLFADRRNLVNLRFWKMLFALDQFNKDAVPSIDAESFKAMSLREYVLSRGYGQDLLDFYLVPMSSAVWSTPPSKIIDFPANSLLRFFHNHGFLGQKTQHQWWTVEGGAREYVKKIESKLPNSSRKIHSAVERVSRASNNKVQIRTKEGDNFEFDKVIFACHADEALSILDQPREIEHTLLSKFKYQLNNAIVHTDTSVMPECNRCWSSWNYRIEQDGHTATTHYWMNSLQGVSKKKDYFVSLNSQNIIAPSAVLNSFDFHHPIFTLEAVEAQKSLHKLNENSGNIYFCGSYFTYGFHEDALNSSLAVTRILSKTGILV